MRLQKRMMEGGRVKEATTKKPSSNKYPNIGLIEFNGIKKHRQTLRAVCHRKRSIELMLPIVSYRKRDER